MAQLLYWEASDLNRTERVRSKSVPFPVGHGFRAPDNPVKGAQRLLHRFLPAVPASSTTLHLVQRTYVKDILLVYLTPEVPHLKTPEILCATNT